jgi:DNA-binding response OmpR family regulator
MKIALLEDNPAVVELLDATLEMHGDRVKPCASGEALLATLLASPDEHKSIRCSTCITEAMR